MTKHVKLSLFTGMIFSMLLSLGILFNASTAFASPFDNPEVWKNEGVFNPLTPFSSYEWNPESYETFVKEFDQWSINMGQSYYQMEDDSLDTFQQKSFYQIIDDATIDGYNVGFTYKNQDFRSDWDSYRVDIFAMYASDIPLEKHLYIFGIDQDGEDIVLYLDGDVVKKGEHRFQITQNEDLKALFHQVFTNDFLNQDVTQTGYTDMTFDQYMTLTSKEQSDYCNLTPWYEIPDGYCSNKGMMSDVWYEAAREYGKTYGVDREAAYEATYNSAY